MQYLETIKRTKSLSFYQFKGQYEEGSKRYLCSTPQSRAICNCPEILGCEYTELMREAMVSIFKGLPFKDELLKDAREDEICILNFLRGGLNFDLRGALHEAYGLNKHRTSFMTSQRFKSDNRWGVKEDSYRKFKFPKSSVVFIADVVATGVTVDNALEVVFNHIKSNGGSIKYLTFFTIGCHKLEKIMDKYKDVLKQTFDDFVDIHLVYLEGKFRLVDSKTTLKVAIPGTDLVRYDCPLAPEFELSQYEKTSYPLERCTIYDAGSRAFDTPEYTEDVVDYWTKVKKLAEGGLTLYDALKERWPEGEYKTKEEFISRKKESWKGIDKSFLEELYKAYEKRWTTGFTAKSKTKEALIEVCKERLSHF